jgi:hypothetical protein
MSYALIGVGCLECGMDTDFIGIYPTERDALMAAGPTTYPTPVLKQGHNTLDALGQGQYWGGDYRHIVLDLS